jgi:hypothetical protein
MERKIGEVFTFDGKQLEVIEGYCEGCYFLDTLCFEDHVFDIRGECSSEDRKDNEEVCFIKLKEE